MLQNGSFCLPSVLGSQGTPAGGRGASAWEGSCFSQARAFTCSLSPWAQRAWIGLLSVKKLFRRRRSVPSQVSIFKS